MSKTIYIRFYEELNDFLPNRKRKVRFPYEYIGNHTIKDIIGSLGVPHVEVDLILANSKSIPFSYKPKNTDHISVYPEFELFDISPLNHLRSKPLRDPKFILDVHLGKLARMLRMTGFDTLYQNDYKDEEIIRIAEEGKRKLNPGWRRAPGNHSMSSFNARNVKKYTGKDPMLIKCKRLLKILVA